MSNGLRSASARTLLATALTLSLTLGGAFLAVNRLHSSPADTVEHPARPASDDQTKAEVVEPAKRMVAAARLQKPTAGYLLMSCKDRDGPPYQGAVYLNFTVPADIRADTYFQGIAAAMVARGWNEGAPPNQHVFAKILSKDGVTAVVYRDNDYADLGIARLYGQCRDITDHRNDATAWVDITDQIR
ncbi:hypothetical protein [Mycobacterium sp.]|uniref:hypothetical protein n=1 Tax=Mycobacterium sp. TaxID=1785 RepID=UPI003D6C01FC